MLRAESNDELLIGLLFAVLVEDAHVGLTTVESLGGFAETTGQTIVDEGELQNTLEGVQDGHLTLGGITGNLDLLDDLGGVVFYVRLSRKSIVSRYVPLDDVPLPQFAKFAICAESSIWLPQTVAIERRQHRDTHHCC